MLVTFDEKHNLIFVLCEKNCLAGEKRSDVPKEFNWSFPC